MQDRTIQATLGTFVATFLFAMVVLAALPAQEEQRLPELSLAGSIGAQTRRSIAHLPRPDEPPATGARRGDPHRAGTSIRRRVARGPGSTSTRFPAEQSAEID
ncbi:DUF2254 family protein [Micromonospora sp. C31]|uniref:DUF2254 family protein n=1 Tax=Micromonospora sp. C31 TaxID=2824876 RepID=UPI0035B4ED14